MSKNKSQEFHKDCVDITVGKRSYVVYLILTNYYTKKHSKLSMGKFSSINFITLIMNGNHQHYPDVALSTFPVYLLHHDNPERTKIDDDRFVETTHIGSDVWIGQNVKIKHGVKIADGAIVAFESVVTKRRATLYYCRRKPCKSHKEKILR